MIGPSANDIIAMRWRVRVVLRVLALVLLISALAWAAIRVPEFRRLQRMSATRIHLTPRFFELSWFAIPVLMAGSAAALALLGQFGLRLLVPVPKPNCPGCGYDLRKPTSDRCPECGLAIGAAGPH
ncbi:MAG: hypothetical protein ACIAS6_03280 [Phycisphaerales bacterium JB060]